MKVLYRNLLNLYDETEEEVSKDGRSFSVDYVKYEIKEMTGAYFVEAGWCDKGHVPPFNEYAANGLTSSGYGAITASSFAGLKAAGIKEFEWLKSRPKMIKAGMLVLRLMNNVVSHEDEQKRVHCASGVQCYMKHYGVSGNEATKDLRKMIANAWKDINEDCMRPTAVSMFIQQVYLNLIRTTNLIYEHDDSYTNMLSLKPYVVSLFRPENSDVRVFVGDLASAGF
ncbi:unnamed protein product [Dovyalis caffra]|uniref:Terpene synthase metal-binding domain-containing protein n=1 Tax=Dovyalis caffra TaxID=77055 RepID=A0AAV1RN72_9ROSI|nr:unnamed protein product [Dovyalis caffra]